MLTDFAAPKVTNISKECRENNISVLLEWTQEGGVQYNVSVTPSVPITFIENTSVKLLLLYNMEYNVGLEAAGACESKESSTVLLFYGELIHCSHAD